MAYVKSDGKQSCVSVGHSLYGLHLPSRLCVLCPCSLAMHASAGSLTPANPLPHAHPTAGTVLAKKGFFQTITDAVYGLFNMVGLFFSTFSPTTREERRAQALERRGARGGGSSSSSGNTGGGSTGGGSGSGMRHRGANIHTLRQSSQVNVPGGGCSGGGCG